MLDSEIANRVNHFIQALAERASVLTSAAQRHHQLKDDAKIDWVIEDDGTGFLDEWLEQRISAFEVLDLPSLGTAIHLRRIIATATATTLDANLVCFPAPEPLVRPPWRPMPSRDLETSRAEARQRPHKEGEVALWGNFNDQPFILPGSDEHRIDAGGADIGLIQCDDYEARPIACHEMRAARDAALARSPVQLRDWLYTEGAEYPSTCMDTSLPEGQGAAWARWGVQAPTEGGTFQKSLYVEDAEVVSKEICTEEQLRTIDARARKAPSFWQPERVRARALKRKVQLGFLEAAPDLLNREAAQAQLQQRRTRDKIWEHAEYEQRSDEGAHYTQWPACGHWPQPVWGLNLASLAARSAARRAACKKEAAGENKANQNPLLRVRLMTAVKLGNVRRVRSILEQGHRPGASPELWMHACRLRKKSMLRLPAFEVESQGEGVNLVVHQLNGAQVSLKMGECSTVQDVYDRIVCGSSIASGSSKMIENYIRLVTPSGVVVDDTSIALSELFADGEWALTVIIQQRGSLISAEILLLLLDALPAHCRDSYFQLMSRTHAETLVEEAAMAGNDAALEILLDAGLSAEAALSTLCERCHGGAYLIAGEVSRYQKSLLIVFRRYRGWQSLLSGSIRHRWMETSVLPVLQELGRQLPGHSLLVDPQLWSTLALTFGLDKIMECCPESLLGCRAFVVQILRSESGYRVLHRVSTELKHDEDVLFTAVQHSGKAVPLVPRETWTKKLALAALEHHGIWNILKYLPEEEWSEELAWKACRIARANREQLAEWVPESLWSEDLGVELVKEVSGPVWSLVPGHLLNSRNFIKRVLPTKFGFKVLQYLNTDMQCDEELLWLAAFYHTEAVSFIPKEAWSAKLAWAAMQHADVSFIELLPASEWTEDLAFQACQLTKFPLTVLARLPNSIWSERLALELVSQSEKSAFAIPSKLWCISLARQLCHRSWQCLVYAPKELLEDRSLRDELLRVLHDLTNKLSSSLHSKSVDLMSVRSLLQLGRALADVYLFKSDLMNKDLAIQRAAVNLQLQMSLLAQVSTKMAARVCSPATVKSCAPFDKVDIRKEPLQWKFRSLVQLKSAPYPCIALLDAVRCLLDGKSPSTKRSRNWEECRSTISAENIAARLSTFDAADVPSECLLHLAQFLPSAGSARCLGQWALDEYQAAKSLGTLAAWLLHVLQSRLGFDEELSSIEIDGLRSRLTELDELAQSLETSSDISGRGAACAESKMIAGLHREVKAKAAIVEAMQMLKDRLPSIIDHHQTSPSFHREAWLQALVKGFSNVLDEAQVLEQRAEAEVESFRKQLRSTSQILPVFGAAASEPLMALRRSRSLTSPSAQAIINDAKEFLDLPPLPSQMTSSQFYCAHLATKQASTKAPLSSKPSLSSKLPPLPGQTSTHTQIKRSKSLRAALRKADALVFSGRSGNYTGLRCHSA